MTGRLEDWPAEDILWAIRVHGRDSDILRDWKGVSQMNDYQAHKLKQSFEEAAADDEDPEQWVYQDFVQRLEEVTPAWGPRRFDPKNKEIPRALDAAAQYVELDSNQIIRDMSEANAKRRLPWHSKETVLRILDEAERKHGELDCNQDCNWPHDTVEEARQLLMSWYEEELTE